jgi:hypothetical protein
MPTKQQGAQRPNAEEPAARQRDAVIRGQIMHALGQPDALQWVQVRPLWENHFRVNVLVGVDAASVKVAHSYFLLTDGGGNILASTPKITKSY